MGEAAHKEARSRKDEAYWKVLSAALELDVKKGHLKWTMSDLSRKSGVTRSLIYYYFGRAKNDILREAVKLIGEDLCGLTEERNRMWKEGRFRESMKQARDFYERMPYIPYFILEHRNRPTEVGETLRGIEKEFVKRITTFFKCQPAEAAAIFVIYWGLNFAPLVDDDVMALVTGAIQKGFQRG